MGLRDWAFNFFLFVSGVDNISCATKFLEKKSNDVSFDLSRFWLLWWSENQELCFFYLKISFQHIFDKKNIYKNTVVTVINLSMA